MKNNEIQNETLNTLSIKQQHQLMNAILQILNLCESISCIYQYALVDLDKALQDEEVNENFKTTKAQIYYDKAYGYNYMVSYTRKKFNEYLWFLMNFDAWIDNIKYETKANELLLEFNKIQLELLSDDILNSINAILQTSLHNLHEFYSYLSICYTKQNPLGQFLKELIVDITYFNFLDLINYHTLQISEFEQVDNADVLSEGLGNLAYLIKKPTASIKEENLFCAKFWTINTILYSISSFNSFTKPLNQLLNFINPKKIN